MRSVLAIGAMCVAFLVAGCDGGGGSMHTQQELDNDPNIGAEAIKKMGPMPTPKTVMPPRSAKK
jgi:hypothetical protein